MGFLWDLWQQWQIYDAQDRADTAESTAKWNASRTDLQQEHIQELERQIDRLSLIVAALCEHAVASGSTTAEKLQALIDEIDLRDGRLDGCLRKPPRKCPTCSHETHPKRPTCLYCGAQLQTSTSPE